jgi:hypothetical protein
MLSAVVAPLPASASVAISNAPLPAALLSDAMSMYTSGNVSRSFTKGHIKAILHSVFGFSISNSKSREDMLKKLKEQEAERASAAAPATPTRALASVAAPPPLPLVQLPTVAVASPAVSIANVPTAAASAHAAVAAASPDSHTPVSHWLYWRCVEAVLSMESPLNALELSLVVLKVVRQIEERQDEYEREGKAYSHIFFQAFDNTVAKKRDHDFIFDLEERLDDMIDDKNLNENALREHHNYDCSFVK